MSDRFQGVAERTVDLALAVNPVDARTDEPLREAATVSIEGVPDTPLLNPTGYWLFLDPPVERPADSITVRIDPPDRYAERRVEVDASTVAKRVAVYPSTAYAFPSGTTLLQGTVQDGSNDPVADEAVRLQDTTLVTRTASDGSFVLPIEGVATTEAAAAADVLRVDPSSSAPDRVEVYPDGRPETPTIVVGDPEDPLATRDREITEGERIVLDSPIVV